METTRQVTYLARGSRIGIRPWNRRHDRHQIGQWPPYAPALPAHWLVSAPAAGRRLSYALDLSGQARLVGRISLRNVDGGVAELGISLHPDHLGAGLGVEALGLLAKVVSGLAALRLDVAAENLRAIRCYERAGFVTIGEVWRGEYRYLDMARLVNAPCTAPDRRVGTDAGD